MKNRLAQMHDEAFAAQSLERIGDILLELYGDDSGQRNFRHVESALSRYLASKKDEERERDAAFDPSEPYGHLAGKVFAVCYPDNIYDDENPTLETLQNVLKEHFPSIRGIHILPERLMSHSDLWPQDLLHLLEPSAAAELVVFLKAKAVLDENRIVQDAYRQRREELCAADLPIWYDQQEKEALRSDRSSLVNGVLELLDDAYDSHFNDGGFSQKDRSKVDPRFGTVEHIRRISESYALVLDYVVNHLDFQNPLLETFRRREGDGSAFLIISPAELEKRRKDGTLEKTFRPRPFPLFTGMRKYPAERLDPVEEMNRRFREKDLKPLDERLIAFLSVDFKVRNDQGLTWEDRRIFRGFQNYLAEMGFGEERLLTDSDIQAQQKVFAGKASESMEGLLRAMDLDRRYAAVFQEFDDQLFGEKFFIYTTFSESQVDVYPKNEEGFQLVIDDLFRLMGSGEPAMMRMDAIKYLWKEIGKPNFDMEEGNRLIEALRLIMRLASPRILTLDEINSPDPVVYEMGRDGGLYYLFGQVNAVPAAFNACSLEPLKRFHSTMEHQCPADLVAFVMLSTHDGRSVQGLGVQRSDGHVSIEEFYALKKTVEQRGGKVKFRAVPRGSIPADTFRKVCSEADIDESKLRQLFTSDDTGDTLRFKSPTLSRPKLLAALSDAAGKSVEDLVGIPAIDFAVEWIFEGRTPYELCCTTRSSFRSTGSNGKPLSADMEARRLALAQLYLLSSGQGIPAVYFNDLLGLENDIPGYELSGKPRDLNRHKSYLPEAELGEPSDPFYKAYRKLLNRTVEVRAADPSFYPGSREFEFQALSDTVFLNHPHARGSHSFILGNISDQLQEVTLAIGKLQGVGKEKLAMIRRSGLRDELTGQVHHPKPEGGRELVLRLVLPPFAAVWLKSGG